MHWVIQNNIAREERHQEFVEAVKRFGDPYTMVKVIPFAHEMEPDVNPEGPVIAIGSLTMERIVKAKGWSPGVYKNDNFDFRVWSEKWAGHIVNEDAVVCPFGEIPTDQEVFFCRPVLDNKAFTGQVFSLEEYQQWVIRLFTEYGASDLQFDINEVVLVSSPKNIQQEIRFYVVGGKPVTHSMYSMGGRVGYMEEHMTPPDAIAKAEEMIAMWQPAEAFTLDLAMVDGEYKVLEMGCINAAGLYFCNVGKLAQAFRDLTLDTASDRE